MALMSDAIPSSLWPMEDITGLRGLLATLERVDKATGGYTTKVDIRQTGLSLHVTYDKPVPDVLGLGAEIYTMFEQAPALLADACRRLIAAHEATSTEES